MRVITGSARGRRLLELEGLETRPTTDRVKEGVFSALQFDMEDRRVLDLFAGTGQMGIECLSRGAASAVFVDRRKDAAQLVKKNLALTNLQDRARVVNGDSLAFLAGRGRPLTWCFWTRRMPPGCWSRRWRGWPPQGLTFWLLMV